MGAPTSHEERAEVVTKVIALVCDGKSLRKACEEIKVARKTVEDWIDAHPEWSAQYLRARANRAEFLFEQALEIQDEEPAKVVQLGADGEGGTIRVDPAYVAWQSHRVNLRMRMIAKMDPKRYGDKVEIGGLLAMQTHAPLSKEAALEAARDAEEAGEV